MKKTFISFLIMTLVLANISLANISTVQASTKDDDTIKVSLQNIREIVIDNNPALEILDNKLEIAEINRDTAKDDYDDATDPGDEPKSSDYEDSADYQTALADYEDAEEEYETAKKAYETAKENYRTAKTNYNQGVEKQVYQAQTAYLTYLADSSTKELNKDTVDYNENQEKIYKIQYENGFLSKNDYISKVQENTSSNDLSESENTVELDKVKLCNLLGVDPDDDIVINTDITADFQVIAKINYEDDLDTMLSNSIAIDDAKDAIDDLEDEEDTYEEEYDDDDIYDYTHDNAEIELDQAKQTAEEDFKSQYNTLMASYNSLKSSYAKILQEQTSFGITQTQYDYGFISKSELESAKLTTNTDNASFIKDRNECYLQYLKYIQLKEGYSDSES